MEKEEKPLEEGLGEEQACLALGWEDPLEEEMATHSSIFAWRIPWTEEPDGLQSMGSQELDMPERLSRHARIHHKSMMRCIIQNPTAFSHP